MQTHKYMGEAYCEFEMRELGQSSISYWESISVHDLAKSRGIHASNPNNILPCIFGFGCVAVHAKYMCSAVTLSTGIMPYQEFGISRCMREKKVQLCTPKTIEQHIWKHQDH